MKQKYGVYSIWIILSFLLFGYIGTLHLIFRVSVGIILRFVLMNVISIMIPGITIISFLDCKLSKITCTCLSYAFGYALVVVEYFFCELFNRKITFAMCSIFVFLVCIFILIYRIKKNKISLQVDNTFNDVIGMIFFCIIAAISVLVYSANYHGIEAIPVIKLFQDMGFWCTNTVALKLHFPADRLWAYGEELNYHYFSSIPIAFLSEAYDVDVYTMSFQLYSLTKTALLVGSVQFLLDIYGAKKNVRIIGNSILLLATGLEYMVNVTFIYYLYYRPFGSDYGYAYGIIFIAFVLYQWKRKEFSLTNMIITLIMWAMCVGGKGPIAAVLIVFAGLICLYWLFQKQWKNAFGYGIGILLLFIVISYFCTGMFAINSGKEGSYSISLNRKENVETVNDSELIDDADEFSDKNEFQNDVNIKYTEIELSDREATAEFVSQICTFVQHYPNLENIVCAFFTNPLLIISMIFTLILYVYLFCRKKVAFSELYLIISLSLSSVAGIILGIILDVVGHSEMYFSMAAYIPMSCILIELLILLQNDIINFGIIKKRIFIFFIYAMICVELYNANFLYWGSNSIIYWAKRGYEITRGSFTDVDYYSGDIPEGIRAEDVKALRWIKDNTEKDAILLVDKGVLTDIGQYYLYGIFAERQTYYEHYKNINTIQYKGMTRKELVYNVYNNDKEALNMVKNEGVTYIVQTKDVTPQYKYDKAKLEILYSTDTMNIYKIK